MQNIPLEVEITKQIQRYLSGLDGWWGFKVAGGAQQKRGVPDIVGCYYGRFVALEVKRPRVGKVSKLQQHTIYSIRDAGGAAYVVYGVEDVKQVFAGLAALTILGGGGAGTD